jgi:sugar-specific transcriptional regulator TrmB
MKKTELYQMLEELGFSSSDSRIYLSCLELGPATVTKIARRANVERATVYASIERLNKRGLISEPISKHSKEIQVDSPDKLLILAQRKKDSIEEKQKRFKDVLPELLSQVNQRGKQPKVRFYIGKEQFVNLVDQILIETKDTMYFIGDASLYVKLISYSYERKLIHRRLRKKLHINILVNRSTLTEKFREDDIKEMRTTRFLPDDMSFEASFQIFGGRIALWDPLVPLAIVIEDEAIVTMLQAVFSGLWQKAE